MEITVVIALVVAVLAVAAAVWVARRSRAPEAEVETQQGEKLEAAVELEVEEAVPAPASPTPGKSLSDRLSRTRSNLGAKLGTLLGRGQPEDSKQWDELEEALLEGDLGFETTQRLLDRVRVRWKSNQALDAKALLVEESQELIAEIRHGLPDLSALPKPYVISIVGINGVGKTTTIGKLAKHFIGTGRTVLLGAADTFRAAAIAQLKIWSDRTGASFVTGREGADPGAVAFDSVTAGKARGIDIVLLDTAGRLHTKTNLMEELKKVHRVVKKVIPEAPHEVWLIVDGTLGQNSVVQAREFQKALELTGIIVTKLDGTAKGGAVLAIASELKLPIRFIGVGESAEDLVPFEPKAFVEAILGHQ